MSAFISVFINCLLGWIGVFVVTLVMITVIQLLNALTAKMGKDKRQ